MNGLRWSSKLQGRGGNYALPPPRQMPSRYVVAGSKWRPSTNLPGPLTLLAVDAGAGLVPVGATDAKKGRVVATICADPSLHSDQKRGHRT